MITENIRALMTYRLEQADESLEAAKTLLEQKLIRPSINRAYYAMFYAVLALLVTEKKETSKHGGAIALFDRDFVKKGVFTKDFSRWLHDAFDLRQRSDYTALYCASMDEAEKTLENAQVFVMEVKTQIKKI
ncbi:MAG: HEPN domain-containing protein [Desulfobacterales bacterium]|nr:HEPN domain-containing protein [Desulfobacterales bacterium]MBL7204985.1 HEPN domain-containing protein [Desulfobacteraceae bacterium]MBU0735262.1 HEPN domain-containing protein [Pseudomonadota bacterium]